MEVHKLRETQSNSITRAVFPHTVYDNRRP